jgi:hypothetical protein
MVWRSQRMRVLNVDLGNVVDVPKIIQNVRLGNGSADGVLLDC